MDKFSLFDLLSYLLPGIILLYFLKIMTIILGLDFVPTEFELSHTGEIGIGLCLSILLGSVLFVISNILKNSKVYRKVLGIYKPIGLIVYSMTKPDEFYFNNLNQKSRELFQKDLFFDNESFQQLSQAEKDICVKLQDRFYSIAYYELQYENKIEYPKTYQSFYYFFRQLVTATSLMIICLACTYFKVSEVYKPQYSMLLFCVILIGWISVINCRHFRSEMVKKMYITYNQHLLNKYENHTH